MPTAQILSKKTTMMIANNFNLEETICSREELLLTIIMNTTNKFTKTGIKPTKKTEEKLKIFCLDNNRED